MRIQLAVDFTDPSANVLFSRLRWFMRLSFAPNQTCSAIWAALDTERDRTILAVVLKLSRDAAVVV
ncbi:hypothetical protein [Rhodopirellula sp. SWK7]|uniref:hypothetical protein n=1 Tax=Rhodopirellula sp. SWK7 TaxID=595460 RepID=UPI001F41975F|nr:hypothetical protein [Rhodopirellula sp. SWK7]